MSEEIIYKCDACRTMLMPGDYRYVTIVSGIDVFGVAFSGGAYIEYKRLDFCSQECLLAFLDKLGASKIQLEENIYAKRKPD